MPINEHAVLDRLRAVEDPEQKKNVVELGWVGNVKIGGGNVSFELQLPPEVRPRGDDLRRACTDAVKRLEGVGYVAVNVTEQVRQAGRQADTPLSRVKNVVAVASGKGGVGKSTTAVNLAAALQRMGHKVGVLDADIYGPSIPTMIAIDKPPAQGATEREVVPAEGHGMKIISMAFFMPQERAAILRGPMVSGYVSQFLQSVLWGELDYLIVDYPPGTGDIQLTLSQRAPLTGAVVTTTPQDISLVDVARAISMFETTHVPVLGICETMSYFVCDSCNKRHDIFRSGGGEKMALRNGVPFLGGIPIDPRVTTCSDAGRPIVAAHPETEAAQSYVKIAEAVASQLEILNRERGQYLENFKLEWKTA